MTEAWGYFDKKYLEMNGSQIQENYQMKNQTTNP
jgi:hypothetical protein